MEDDEEMRNQCFGGEYMGEVYDHMIKRMAYRKQKRWWNAYILLYERYDFENEPVIAELQTALSAMSLSKLFELCRVNKSLPCTSLMLHLLTYCLRSFLLLNIRGQPTFAASPEPYQEDGPSGQHSIHAHEGSIFTRILRLH